MATFLPGIRLARLAARSLARRPWFTLAAVLCMALGLGAAVAVFSIADAVLLRALPYDDPGRIAVLWNRSLEEGLDKLPFSAAELLDLGEQVESLEHLAAVIPSIYGLSGEGEPERLIGARASASLFPALGVEAEVGRTFTADEDRWGNEHVALLSHGLWQRRFGGDRGVVGRTVLLDGVPFTVVGVLPAGFFFADGGFDLWVPIAFNLQKLAPRQARGLTVVGRLAPGVTWERARAEMDGIARRFQQDHPETYPPGGWGIGLVPIRDELVGGIRPALLALAAAVALVMLIAGVNVANLLLARATARGKEIAIRKALGAGRADVVRQFLAESLLISLAGAALGLLLATWGIRALVAMNPGNIPRLDEIGVGLRSAAFGVAAALAAGLLFGLAPAFQAARGRVLQGTLKEGGKTSAAGGSRGRLRSALVICEVALAVVVLVSAGLVLKSFRRLAEVDPGFRTDVLVARMLLPKNQYVTPELIQGFYRRLVPSLRSLPGVISAGAVSSLPLEDFQQLLGVTVPGREERSGGSPVTVNRLIADPGYFRTMGIRLLRGRGFADSDDERAVPVAVIDSGLARRLWPDEDPIGRRLALEPPEPNAPDGRTVVGVVAPVRQQAMDVPSPEQLYVPYSQAASIYMALVLRPGGRADPASLASGMRAAIRALDDDQTVSEMSTMEEVLADSISRARVNALLFGAFAALALALAVVGVYGVMAYTVAQRTQEIGIRMALGARRASVLRMVVRQGLALAGAGLVLGLAASLAVTRLLASLLYGVETTDVATFVLVLAILLGLALVACLLPARRATRVDPMLALRAE